VTDGDVAVATLEVLWLTSFTEPGCALISLPDPVVAGAVQLFLV
jgi:hypothetical protein